MSTVFQQVFRYLITVNVMYISVMGKSQKSNIEYQNHKSRTHVDLIRLSQISNLIWSQNL